MLQINPALLLPPHIPAESETSRESSKSTSFAKFKAGDKVSATYRSGVTIIGEIVSRVERSLTLYLVRDTDRGAGYDERSGKYVGIRTAGGWSRSQNYGFDTVSKFHINQITPQTCKPI